MGYCTFLLVALDNFPEQRSGSHLAIRGYRAALNHIFSVPVINLAKKKIIHMLFSKL